MQRPWCLAETIPRATGLAQPARDIRKEIRGDHLPSVGPISSAVDRPCICPSVDQVGEDVSRDGVVVTGQEHPEMRAILDGRIQKDVAYTAEAEPCMSATHSTGILQRKREAHTELWAERLEGRVCSEHAGAQH